MGDCACSGLFVRDVDIDVDTRRVLLTGEGIRGWLE